VAGEFNLIVDDVDMNNANLNRRMMGKFRCLLSELELKELYLNGHRYTWSNERELPTLERLDIVLACGFSLLFSVGYVFLHLGSLPAAA
jgi:hypothetical protein